MSYKLWNINNRAVLIKDNQYYDVESISKNAFSSNTVEALTKAKELNDLSANLENESPTGSLSDVELGNPVPDSKNCYAIGLNYRKHAEESGIDRKSVV